MKTSKPVTWILVVALAGIWGTIFYNIYVSVSGGESGDETAATSPVRTEQSGGDRFVYTGDVRDPFRATPVVDVKKVAAPKKVQPAPVWTPPPMKLSGILVSDKKHTALIECADGSTNFLKEGDTLRGVKILRITPTAVNYLFMKKKGEWVLENK